MQIHVARQQQQLGVFAPEEIIAGLSSGRFHPADLAWRDGMAGWTPLGDWPEFRHAGVPASPGAPAKAAASMIPWEQGKSLASFFATIKMGVAHPGLLATGRLAVGDWLTFCYVAVACSLPFQLINVLVYGDKNAEIAEWLRGLRVAELNKFADQLATAEPAPAWITVFGALMGLAFAPLSYAFFALLHWVGQKIFRYPVPVERTVSAALLATGLLAVLMTPLQLLGFSFSFQMAVGILVLIPACVVYYRAFGAATGVNPWVQFGISCFVWFVLCCCCCAAPLAMILAAMPGGAIR